MKFTQLFVGFVAQCYTDDGETPHSATVISSNYDSNKLNQKPPAREQTRQEMTMINDKWKHHR